MKLHHRMLRHFIAASVIVLTSSFLIFELVASDRAMSAYLRYIVQKADSSFLYDKYQNQSIAAHVMRALAAEQSEVSPEQRRAICEAFESASGIPLCHEVVLVVVDGIEKDLAHVAHLVGSYLLITMSG